MASRTPAALLRSRGAWAVAGIGMALVLAVVGVVGFRSATDDSQISAGPSTDKSFDEPMPSDHPSPSPNRHHADWRDAAGEPVRLAIPSLGVRARVVGIAAPNGVLAPPSDPAVLGWWDAGAFPGAAHGNALITGHTVHTGGGALDDIASLEPGDRVRVATVNGRIQYVVRSVVVYSKAELEQQAARVFRQDGPGRLALITCDDWDGAAYQSNAVVFATPV
jgi:LPXTG-site transpeptidase (sortase) family protein